ncbi:DUF3823 domain-containing protein [Dinghuibacter silviterrae]|uniref:Uncharacterized protein DUF3823 n=1 Tax=Dinghuibacter silviterrae TaxID=1539049 RepID=A0A4R8DT53_9BACT|nr:DUF3823 domain-containing protein [Dinghuibacter silviterrae]TDX00331.1 uncharacterized protein DUF3823 [Dinghuibacter silviterrae]
MKRYYIVALLFCAACNKIDNYPAPSCTIAGSTIDEVTGQTVQTEAGGGGTRVKLLETSYSSNPVPQYFQSMQSGVFNDTKIFAATYNVSVEGPFVPLVQTDANGNVTSDSSQNIVLKSIDSLHFRVQPYLRITWVGQPVLNPDTTVTVQFIVTRGTNNPNYQQDITDINLYVSNTQYDGNYNYDPRYSKLNSYSGSTGTALLGQVITLTTIGGALPAQDVYFRVGARINAGLDEYNYNAPVSVTYP